MKITDFLKVLNLKAFSDLTGISYNALKNYSCGRTVPTPATINLILDELQKLIEEVDLYA